jgi:uncharacterized protein YejL (UPF0352 family)
MARIINADTVLPHQVAIVANAFAQTLNESKRSGATDWTGSFK